MPLAAEKREGKREPGEVPDSSPKGMFPMTYYALIEIYIRLRVEAAERGGRHAFIMLEHTVEGDEIGESTAKTISAMFIVL